MDVVDNIYAAGNLVVSLRVLEGYLLCFSLLLHFIEPCHFFLVKFAAVLVSSPTLVLVVSLFYGSFTDFTMAIDCLKQLVKIHSL